MTRSVRSFLPLAPLVPLLALAGPSLRQDEPPIDPVVELTEQEVRRALQHAPLGPPPPDPTNRVADDPRAVRLGRHLFFDPALSGNGEISCATCHDPELELADGKPLAEGLGTTSRRSPTLWNVAHGRWFFWDGRADSLWAQAMQPIESELEMGGDRTAIAHYLAGDEVLRAAYEELFGALPELSDPARFPERAKPLPDARDDARHRAWIAMGDEERRVVDRVFSNAAKALAAYERRLVLGPAPFDRFVEGLRDGDAEKLRALSPAALRGLKLFVGRGNCRLCHVGPAFSDGEFHSLSLPTEDARAPRDPGRYEGLRRLAADPFNGAGEFSDDAQAGALRIAGLATSSESWGEFKTPSLRGVALRGPFMHRGQFESLREVLHFYSTLEGAVRVHRHQEDVLAPLELGAAEIEDLIAFLGTLNARPVDPEILIPFDMRSGQ